MFFTLSLHFPALWLFRCLSGAGKARQYTGNTNCLPCRSRAPSDWLEPICRMAEPCLAQALGQTSHLLRQNNIRRSATRSPRNICLVPGVPKTNICRTFFFTINTHHRGSQGGKGCGWCKSGGWGGLTFSNFLPCAHAPLSRQQPRFGIGPLSTGSRTKVLITDLLVS